MNQITPVDEERAITPQQKFRNELTRMADQFIAALPEHIKPERFQRIVLTAVLGDPQLLRADRKSLLEAAMRAAQDGLLPDKREGAFVCFGNSVQWMPMIQGIIKKMHQSGEIAMITAKVVYGGDSFRAWVDDDGEHVSYEQAEHPDYDTIRQVFALARTKEGAVYVETLTPRDIDKIRSVSRAKNSGPWVMWWEEMAKKSAIRRLAKRLPLSADIHDLMQRDNDLYDLSRAPDPQPSLRDRLTSNRAQAAIEHHEGFDPDFTAYEAETTSTAEDAETEQPDAPLSPSGSGSSGNETPPIDNPAAANTSASNGDEPEVEDTSDEADEAGHDGTAASTSGDNQARIQLMRECIDNMIRAATDPDKTKREGLVTKSYAAWLRELAADEPFVKRVFETCCRLIEDPGQVEVAKKYLRSKVS